jgi:hypothetical protein
MTKKNTIRMPLYMLSGAKTRQINDFQHARHIVLAIGVLSRGLARENQLSGNPTNREL